MMTSTRHVAPTAGNYYQTKGEDYFAHRAGARSDRIQQLRSRFFQDLAGEDLKILDFGCGDGGIISALPAARRIGVEIGERASGEAAKKGIAVHSSLAEIAPGTVDVAISFHALEHVDHPLDAMWGILLALKPGGRARLVVPCETPVRAKVRSWAPNLDQHLYTWTPLNFGNLAARAGFERIETRLAPMPSGSRAARIFGTRSLIGRGWSTFLSLRDNSYNVVLDAFAPVSEPRD